MKPELKSINVIPTFAMQLNGLSNKQKIDVGEHFDALTIRITGILNVLFGGVPVLVQDGIMNLINSILIQLSAGQQPKSYNGEILYKLNYFDYGVAGEWIDPALGIGANPFAISLKIPFSCLNGFPSLYTIFNSRKLKGQNNEQFNLEILLGNEASILGASLTTETITGVQCIVNADILEGEESNIYVPMNAESMKVTRLPLGVGVFTTAVDLKSGNALKRIAIYAEDAGLLNSDVVIQEVRIRKGTKNYVAQWNWLQLKAENLQRYGLSPAPVFAGIPPVGFALIELDKNNDFTNLLNTDEEKQVYLEIDTLAPCFITVLAQEIIS